MSFIEKYDTWYFKYIEPKTNKTKIIKIKKKKVVPFKKFIHPNKIRVNPYLMWK